MVDDQALGLVNGFDLAFKKDEGVSQGNKDPSPVMGEEVMSAF